MSTVHSGLDTRIFYKECLSLLKAGFDVELVINATNSDIKKANNLGINIHSINASSSSRFVRLITGSFKCWRLTKEINARIYHFHDVELIPLAILLKLSGAEVIYDVHEDVPVDIMSKEWIPKWLRKAISKSVALLEGVAVKLFFTPVCATPYINDRFLKYSSKSTCVCNYPIIDEFLISNNDQYEKESRVTYVGGLNSIRGIKELIDAIDLSQSDVRLTLAGLFQESDLESDLRSKSGWSRTDYKGWLDRDGIRDILCSSSAGIVTLHPISNYIDALPVKMFEYMAAGLPVIASNFPMWKEIVEGSSCGVCVDPLDSEAISSAIDFIIGNPEASIKMGENGRRAVIERFNWKIEEKKLVDLYKNILS